MVTLNDKFLPTEGINYVFSEIENCELESRPSRIGFKGTQHWFRKRNGVTTDDSRTTRGDIQYSTLFNGEIYTYTDEGFVYSFDGEDMDAVDIVPSASISQSLANTSLNINIDTSIKAQGQEFQAGANLVIRNIIVSIRSVGTLNPGCFVRCKITTAADKSTVIATSDTIISASDISSSFTDVSFNFDNVYVPVGQTYFFYVEVLNTSNSGYIEIEAQTGDPYVGGDSYNLDNSNIWTVNGTTDLYFTVDATGQLFYDGINYAEYPTVVSYLGGGVYPTTGFTATVLSYNAGTGEVVVTAPLPGAVGDFINKYLYILTGTGNERQYVPVIDQTNSTTLFINDALLPVPLAGGETITFYNTIEQQIFFTQLRRGSLAPNSQYLYSRTRSGQNNYWYFPNSRQIVFWDNRIVSMKLDQQGLLFSDSQNLEIPTLLTVSFGNEKALDMAPYGAYLMVFFDNKVGVVRKTIINAGTGQFAYVYQDLVSTGIFSKHAYLIRASDLYIFSKDRRLYSVNIDTLTINELSADLEDQGDILENFFNLFNENGDVSFSYVGGTLRLIYRFGSRTEVYKYLETYQVWVVDTYNFAGNFMNWIYNINGETASCKDNTFVLFKGIQDLGQNITQRIKIYGPIEGYMATHMLLKTKLRIGFDYINQIGGRVLMSIGGYHLKNKVYDLADIQPIQEINQVIASAGLIGEPMVAQYLVGGEYYSREQLKQIYPEILDVGFNVGNRGNYFTLEVINDENKQLYIQTLNPIYNTESDLVIPNKGVIPSK